MEHKLEKATFSKDIKNRVRALQERDNWRNLFTIAFDWLVIIGAIALVQTFPMWWVYLISIAIIGSRMRAFDNLMHEASHFQLFKNKILNKWIACFFVAFPVFTSFTAYCQSHYLHHRHLWHEQKDPDTKRYALMGLDKPQDDIRSFILRHVLKPLTLTHVPKYIYGTIKVNILTKEEPISEKVAKSLFWPVIVLLSVVFDFWLELFLFWFIPLLTTFQIIRYWAEMAEHSGLKNTHELYSSRNTFGNPIQRFFLHPHHDNYHLVHHLFPAVPHYRLKKAHTILMENESYREAHHCTGFFKSFLQVFIVSFKIFADYVSEKIGQLKKQNERTENWMLVAQVTYALTALLNKQTIGIRKRCYDGHKHPAPLLAWCGIVLE